MLILLVLLALSLGEASADATEPDGEVMQGDLGLDADDLIELADHSQLDVLDELSDGLEAIDLDDLDELDLDELAASNDRDDLDRAEAVAWPATGTTDARAAALARRHSLLGRLDLSLTWRRTEPIASPRRDEVWLYGTWRL